MDLEISDLGSNMCSMDTSPIPCLHQWMLSMNKQFQQMKFCMGNLICYNFIYTMTYSQVCKLMLLPPSESLELNGVYQRPQYGCMANCDGDDDVVFYSAVTPCYCSMLSVLGRVESFEA